MTPHTAMIKQLKMHNKKAIFVTSFLLYRILVIFSKIRYDPSESNGLALLTELSLWTAICSLIVYFLIANLQKRRLMKTI